MKIRKREERRKRRREEKKKEKKRRGDKKSEEKSVIGTKPDRCSSKNGIAKFTLLRCLKNEIFCCPYFETQKDNTFIEYFFV
jgi:hypothetical protein